MASRLAMVSFGVNGTYDTYTKSILLTGISKGNFKVWHDPFTYSNNHFESTVFLEIIYQPIEDEVKSLQIMRELHTQNYTK